MQKKYIIISAVLAAIFIIVGLFIFLKDNTNKEFEDNVDIAIQAIEEQDFPTAEEYFGLALTMRSDEQVSIYLEQTQNIEKAIALEEANKNEEALELYTLVAQQENGLDILIALAEEKMDMIYEITKKIDEYNNQFITIDSLIANKNDTDASSLLSTIISETKDDEEFADVYQQATDLLNSINTVSGDETQQVIEEQTVEPTIEIEEIPSNPEEPVERTEFEAQYYGIFTTEQTEYYSNVDKSTKSISETTTLDSTIEDDQLYGTVYLTELEDTTQFYTFSVGVDENGGTDTFPLFSEGSPIDGSGTIKFESNKIILMLEYENVKHTYTFNITE